MRKSTLLAVALVVAAVTVLAPTAGAASATCTGVVSGTVIGNLVVPEGQSCTLAGAHVHGSVIVERAASLHAIASATGRTTIDHDVLGQSVRFVLLQYETQVGGDFIVDGASSAITGFDINVRIGGNAKIRGNAAYTFVDAAIVGGSLVVSGSTGGIEVEWNRVGGSATILANMPTSMTVVGNQVVRSFTVSNNRGLGFKQVLANTADRLWCDQNDAPFIGGPNSAGQTGGQCF